MSKKLRQQPRKVIVTGRQKIKKMDDRVVLSVDEPVAPLNEEPSIVKYMLGATLSMGGYEFLRVDVGISEPCLTKNVHTVMDRLKGEVMLELDKEIKKLRQLGMVGQ